MADQPPTFGANQLTNTSTAVPKAGGDNHIPIDGSAAADWKTITANTFLPGPHPGQEQTLIKLGDQTAKVATGEQKHDVQKDATTHVHAGDNNLFYHKNRKTDVHDDDTLTIHQNQTINVTEKHKLEAKNVEITGIQQLTLNVGGNYIKIDPSGITIFGTLVKIN